MDRLSECLVRLRLGQSVGPTTMVSHGKGFVVTSNCDSSADGCSMEFLTITDVYHQMMQNISQLKITTDLFREDSLCSYICTLWPSKSCPPPLPVPSLSLLIGGKKNR